MQPILVLGLGNVLYGDEGLGVHAAQRLYQAFDLPEHVRVLDGGTQGHSLLFWVEGASRLIVLDAADFGQPPGGLVVRAGADIPRYLTSKKVSPHQNSFSEVLALAELRGTLPEEIVLIGMQPVAMRMGEELTPEVRAGLGGMVDAACEWLRAWGVELHPVDATAPGEAGGQGGQGRELLHRALSGMSGV